MARIRTIKPEFWSSEQISNVSISARLLFIGFWNFCDDNGVLPASCKSLRMKIFPGDLSVSDENVAVWINELLEQELLVHYIVETKSYWKVDKFTKHQKIDKPAYKYPSPEQGELVKYCQNSATIRQPVGDYSTTTPIAVDDCPPAEGNGMEGKVEKKTKTTDVVLEKEKIKRKSQYPPDFKISDDHIKLATKLGLPIPLDEQLAAFRDYHESHGSTFKRWDLAFNTWLRNAKKFRGKSNGISQGSSKPSRTEQSLLDTIAWTRKQLEEQREEGQIYDA